MQSLRPMASQVYGPACESADFLPAFKAGLRVNIISDEDDEVVFDLIGVEAPIANALRRILIAEVRVWRRVRELWHPLVASSSFCAFHSLLHCAHHCQAVWHAAWWCPV